MPTAGRQALRAVLVWLSLGAFSPSFGGEPAPQRFLVGDCDTSASVEIGELVRGVNIALERLPLQQCPNLDANGDAQVTIEELVLASQNVFDPVHFLACGDTLRTASEQCDDGNRTDGDGCSVSCRIEGGPILDQFWPGYRADCNGGGSEHNLGLVPSLGQEFRPTVATVSAISVYVRSALSDSATERSGSIELNLREESIDGPVVATVTRTITPPPGRTAWQRLDFVAPVAVVPGAVYVIELFSAEDRLMWVAEVNDAGCEEEGYKNGARIVSGTRDTTADYGFAVFGTDEQGAGPIDQHWFGPHGLCGVQTNVFALEHGAIAQSFTPTVPELGSVAVGLAVSGHDGGPLNVNIRRGSVTGPLVAARSFRITPPAQDALVWYRFDFIPPRLLLPGTPYVIELADLQNRFGWVAAVGDEGEIACHEGEYPGGSGFVFGQPLAAGDFLFATFGPPP